MKLINSLKSRYYSFISNHYEHTRDGVFLKKLKNIHLNNRCFIIGNGPSLISKDLDCLMLHKEISFAFNRIYHIFKDTLWRPTYYIAQDDKILENSYEDISLLKVKYKFIPIELCWYSNININNATYFHLHHSNMDKIPTFSEDISKAVINSRTVVFSAIQFAVYMGIKDIYLIGVDHHFHKTMNNNGEIIIDDSIKDYFTNDYNKDNKDLYIPNTEASTLSYLAAKQYADKHDINIYNATRGGKLEVFPRVNFDSLF